MKAEAISDFVEGLSVQDIRQLSYLWDIWARPAQLPPQGCWRVWLLMAGRGFGKTRTGAEWVRAKKPCIANGHAKWVTALLKLVICWKQAKALA